MLKDLYLIIRDVIHTFMTHGFFAALGVIAGVALGGYGIVKLAGASGDAMVAGSKALKDLDEFVEKHKTEEKTEEKEEEDTEE